MSKEPVLTKQLHKNIRKVQEQFHHSPELTIRLIQFDQVHKFYGAILYIDSIVNVDLIRQNIIEPLRLVRRVEKSSLINTLAILYLQSESVEIVQSMSDIVNGIVRGKSLLLVEGYERALLLDTAEWQHREIEQSTNQRNIQGPLISFAEQLKGNLNLLHNSIQSPTLMVEKKQIGTIAKTDIAIVYLTDLVDQKALDEVHRRIDALQVNYVIGRVIEDAIEGNQKTIFPLSFKTDLPDAVVSALFEGRIAVMVNGVPQAVIVPNVFVQYFQQPSEYYMKARIQNRLLSFICFFASILLPGVYMSIANFHENWFPKEFAKAYFTHSHTVLPFWFEVFLLLVLLQILGIGEFRVSREMLVLVSLIATVTIGSTAVEAKLFHPLSLIVIGVTFLSNTLLVIGEMTMAVNTTRYVFTFLGALFGLTGICLGLVLLFIHLARLRSVGVPFLAPIVPFHYKEFKDVLIRGDLRKLSNSPHHYPHDEK
ncbi:spore germination protein [Gottfriedia acidiceleris]|uniref:spore germination protein n=1 Tax=Gottfriedia acidiceleris TaxID=371036 RepID=UPI000B42EDF3|nr:spore germination protein [Gottfriedia acidiceleris]